MDQLNNSNTRIGGKVNIIFLGVAFSIAYWILEAVRDVIGFGLGTITERIFYPDAMTLWVRLLVVFIIILFSAYVQSLKAKTNDFKVLSPHFFDNLSIPWIIIIFSLFYWILEAVRDVIVFKKESLIHQIFVPDLLEFWSRFLGLGILILLGLHVQRTIAMSKAKEQEMETKHDQSVTQFKKRIDELEKEIQRLINERQSIGKELNKKDSAMWEWGDLYYNNSHMMAKTNLQNICKFLDLKKESIHDANVLEIINDLSARLYTLSLVHSQIVKERRFDKIDIKEYLKNSLGYISHIFITTPVQLNMDNEKLELPTKYAFTCAIIANELATNVYKHAFQKGDSGHLDVEWKVDEGKMCTIRFKDNGEGISEMPEIDQMQTAGLRWVKDLVESQLKGRIMVYPENGMEIKIQFQIV